MGSRTSELEQFAGWVEGLMRERGYDIDSPRGGGRTRLAEDAGVHRAAVTRLLQRQSMPDLDTMRGLARVLGVSLRDVLVRSGRATEAELPLPGAVRGGVAVEGSDRLTPEEAAVLLGIPGSHRRQFVEMTEMILAVSGVAAKRAEGGRRGASGGR
ncbi:helix-turn-helix transcriptional regulator [Streptomyces sp. I05A-00742]|uniref:helix-turn-helix domain-containing protein n=1 Tax=Streptomyces sp. I05A-00742 TaxID=2732853 RepID=UPI0014899F85|nr:helix-turn-helix transcriptional regulator [Streptomyces sp. I05A-00742]